LRARVGDSSDERGVQAVVFALVAATFLTVYVTQPVLPILRVEFGVTLGIASLTVSAVVLGIALANLPFGGGGRTPCMCCFTI